MKRSVFREYSFDWSERPEQVPTITQLDAKLQTLSFRREAYSLDSKTRYRPYGIYLLIGHGAKIAEAQLRDLDAALEPHLQPRFTHARTVFKWSVEREPGKFESELEIIIALPSGLEETRAVMKLLVLVYKALDFHKDVPPPVITNETYVKPSNGSGWMSEGVYLMDKYWFRYCEEEGVGSANQKIAERRKQETGR